ncbi:MAG TPA: monovalent cation/H(+) antiporter subunit G [Caldilineaceae bacterium]|nr:monovalent cation/H(+) antiporter subunit G [Caldilineaceae bacterium]
MSLLQIVILIIAGIGVLFTAVSAVGILRLPDVYARMHAAGKASTLGVSCILLAAGLYHGEDELFRMIVLIALFFVTGPIAVTTMARAAYRTSGDSPLILHYDELASAHHQQEQRALTRPGATTGQSDGLRG